MNIYKQKDLNPKDLFLLVNCVFIYGTFYNDLFLELFFAKLSYYYKIIYLDTNLL